MQQGASPWTRCASVRVLGAPLRFAFPRPLPPGLANWIKADCCRPGSRRARNGHRLFCTSFGPTQQCARRARLPAAPASLRSLYLRDGWIQSVPGGRAPALRLCSLRLPHHQHAGFVTSYLPGVIGHRGIIQPPSSASSGPPCHRRACTPISITASADKAR
jgi:hypothetical protein